MQILYHHRTGATDAQRVHILEIVRALRGQGHGVQFASLVDPETASPTGDTSAGSGLRRLLGKLKGNKYIYDLAQIAYNFYAVPKMISQARRMKADAIYERHALFNAAGVIAARWLKLPIIIEVNSPLAMEQRRENAIGFEALGATMERWSLNRANQVLAVTTPLKNILVAMGVRGDKITVMPNGIDMAHFDISAKADTTLKAQLGLTDKVLLGFVGWFRDWHGIDNLVTAVATIAKDNPKIGLLLIGDGPARAGLEQQIATLKMANHVKITGAVAHDHIPTYLALVDVATQPAANEYCCPMKVIEYMGMGKPIVAPDQPNLSELITDGNEGLLFKPGNVEDMTRALRQLADDAVLRKKLGTNAVAAIQSRGLLWSANAARVVEMFKTARNH
jgi:glycosyltransferase involved in cell wall biosynthesis